MHDIVAIVNFMLIICKYIAVNVAYNILIIYIVDLEDHAHLSLQCEVVCWRYST